MNKRYIDFVPVDRRKTPMAPLPTALFKSQKQVAKKSVAKKPESRETIVRRDERAKTFNRNTTGVVSKSPVVQRKELPFEKKSGEKSKPARVSRPNEPTNFGVIEDYRPKFVKAPVDKRPLGTASAGVRANFINVNKVEKRPLSKSVRAKNVYAKKPTTVRASVEKTAKKESKKEESKKPVVIITKPEKDSKIGLVVAVILTIILGAAAGTVAFLLLPK